MESSCLALRRLYQRVDSFADGVCDVVSEVRHDLVLVCHECFSGLLHRPESASPHPRIEPLERGLGLRHAPRPVEVIEAGDDPESPPRFRKLPRKRGNLFGLLPRQGRGRLEEQLPFAEQLLLVLDLFLLLLADFVHRAAMWKQQRAKAVRRGRLALPGVRGCVKNL